MDAATGVNIFVLKLFIQKLPEMKDIIQINPAKDFAVPWFKRWFDSRHYHQLYNNHNEREAADFVRELCSWLQPLGGSRILDLGCGAGRHSKHLAAKGFRVTGIDLAASSIRDAKKWENDFLHFIRQDMRIPFGSNHFDYIFNFFTSFGYFKTYDENGAVIGNMSKALKNQGTLVIDYMNVCQVEKNLVLSEEKEIDGIIYYISRWTDEKYIYKKIVVEEGQSGEPFENVEQVARFGLEDFKRMFRENDLKILEVFGDYKLNPFDLNASPRLILIAERAVRSSW
jgi:SAM-dependent methyltransferase